MATVQDDRRAGTQREMENEPRNEQSMPRPTQMQRAEKTLIRGLSADAIASGGAVVLAILALADVVPTYLAPVAVLAVGVALLLKSGTVAARFRQFAGQDAGFGEVTELGGGMSAEMYAGVAGITLGVLALVGIAPVTLMAIAIIVYGGAMLLGGGETYRLTQFAHPRRPSLSESAARFSAETSAGGESLVGIGAVVLGILALTDVVPLTLVLVGVLSLGGAAFLSAFTASTHAATLLKR